MVVTIRKPNQNGLQTKLACKPNFETFGNQMDTDIEPPLQYCTSPSVRSQLYIEITFATKIMPVMIAVFLRDSALLNWSGKSFFLLLKLELVFAVILQRFVSQNRFRLPVTILKINENKTGLKPLNRTSQHDSLFGININVGHTI